MDERTPERTVDSKASSEPEPAPPLPPSPLAEAASEGPPDTPLPWSTVGLGALAGIVGGAVGEVLLVNWLLAWVFMGLIDGMRGALLSMGAVLGDRLAPSQPRPVRWGAGMGAAYSLFAIIGVRLGPSRHAVVCSLTAALAGILLAALLGSVLGLVAQGNRTVWWRLPLAAVIPAAGMGSTHTIGTAVASATVPHAPPAAIGWAMVPVVALVSAGPFGLLFGLALAERLNAARRRAMDDSRTDGEAAS